MTFGYGVKEIQRRDSSIRIAVPGEELHCGIAVQDFGVVTKGWKAAESTEFPQDLERLRE